MVFSNNSVVVVGPRRSQKSTELIKEAWWLSQKYKTKQIKVVVCRQEDEAKYSNYFPWESIADNIYNSTNDVLAQLEAQRSYIESIERTCFSDSISKEKVMIIILDEMYTRQDAYSYDKLQHFINNALKYNLIFLIAVQARSPEQAKLHKMEWPNDFRVKSTNQQIKTI